MDVPPPGIALVEELDRRLLVQLRDGRKVLGILRTFDQFANLGLEDASERIIVGDQARAARRGAAEGGGNARETSASSALCLPLPLPHPARRAPAHLRAAQSHRSTATCAWGCT